MTKLLAYHNDPALKERTVAEMKLHREADQIVQGMYWDDGKGCAVGCMTHDPNGGHEKYPTLWGIPEQLAWLEDTLFESLSVEDSKEWPVRFLEAIPVGADLSRAWDKWQAWCLRDLLSIAGESASVVEIMAVLFERASVGDEPSDAEWNEAADAADADWDAEAAWAARTARTARDARDARGVRVARTAWAAWDARAAWDAWDVWDVPRNEWTLRASDALIEILEKAKYRA